MISRRNKFGARKTEWRGEIFDSAAEANVAAILDQKKRASLIEGWERGTSQVLVDGGTRDRRISYKPDFIVYFLDQHREVWDCKGLVRLRSALGKRGKMLPGRLVLAKDFRLRAILWEIRFPNLPVVVVDRDGNERWRLK